MKTSRFIRVHLQCQNGIKGDLFALDKDGLFAPKQANPLGKNYLSRREEDGSIASWNLPAGSQFDCGHGAFFAGAALSEFVVTRLRMRANVRGHVKNNFLITRHLRDYMLTFISLFKKGDLFYL